MSGPAVQVGATVMCPHGGQVAVVSVAPRVFSGGVPLATIGDTFPIAGCAFTVPPGKPQPCVLARWIVPALRVRFGGQAAVLQSSTGICQSPEQIPQGPPSIAATQLRVSAT